MAKVKGKLLPVCSGTLISPRVFLTAGHCTEFEIEEDRPAYVSFDPTYKPGASKLIKGTPYPHPKACLAARKAACHPIGGAVAGYPATTLEWSFSKQPVRMATYGALPEAGLVDTLKEGQRLTAVGYGVSGYERGGDGTATPASLSGRPLQGHG